MRPATFFLLIPVAAAFEVPFSVPRFFKLKAPAPSFERAEITDAPITPRVAIIGAGAGGSSAAFWISKAKSRFGLDIDIDVYDRNNYIGGRM